MRNNAEAAAVAFFDALADAVADRVAEKLAARLPQQPAQAKAETAAPLAVGRVEAAKMLGIGARHVDALISDGKLPALKLGRSVRIARADLLDFIERNKQSAGVVA